jgi:hypothetical protein
MSIENILPQLQSKVTYFISLLQIWSLGSNDPIHVLEVDSQCECLVWGSDTKDEATTKSFIAWSDVLNYFYSYFNQKSFLCIFFNVIPIRYGLRFSLPQ